MTAKLTAHLTCRLAGEARRPALNESRCRIVTLYTTAPRFIGLLCEAGPLMRRWRGSGGWRCPAPTITGAKKNRLRVACCGTTVSLTTNLTVSARPNSTLHTSKNFMLNDVWNRKRGQCGAGQLRADDPLESGCRYVGSVEHVASEEDDGKDGRGVGVLPQRRGSLKRYRGCATRQAVQSDALPSLQIVRTIFPTVRHTTPAQ